MAEQGEKTKEQPKQTKETKETEPSVLQIAWSSKRAPSVWDFAAGPRSSSSSSTALGNPALAGVPPKPRCRQCRMLLDNGRCVDPVCLATGSR